MMALWNLFYFIVAIGILVTIHEFGHFWVARKFGVKVLTFSIGFGKPLWQHKAKDGVNYVIATIPLGGYVKMLDEAEQDVDSADKQYAFNQKSVWVRMAIALAGPLANFILAIFLYWWMFVLGIDGLSTQMGNIAPESIAGQAGLMVDDKIVAVDGEPVFLLQDIAKSVARRLGEKTQMQIEIQASSQYKQQRNNNSTQTINLSLANWSIDIDKPNLLGSLGIRHKSQDLKLSSLVSTVNENTPAERAGLVAGDKVVEFNQQPIESWQGLVANIEVNAGKKIDLLIDRNGELKSISVVIGTRELENKTIGYLGVSPTRPDFSNYIVSRNGSLLEAFSLSLNETGKMISLTVQLLKKLLTGAISPKSLSGPISIAEGAGGSASAGLVYFISFVAMISVNLGFINLLPIPLLDGGHILYCVIEVIKGKPLSQKVQELGMQIGMLLVFALMATAIFNDLSRL